MPDTPYVGRPLIRDSDVRHLTGRGQFTDDITLPGMLHAAILRSPQAHAHIRFLDITATHQMPGVIAVYTAVDVVSHIKSLPCNWVLPGMAVPTHHALALDTVRYPGDALAVVVAIVTDHTVTPSPLNPLGVKGIGEAATIATPPAVVNAVVDALAPLGVRHLDMPLSAENVWTAIQQARGGTQ